MSVSLNACVYSIIASCSLECKGRTVTRWSTVVKQNVISKRFRVSKLKTDVNLICDC